MSKALISIKPQHTGLLWTKSQADNPQLQFTSDNIYGGDGGNIDITIADTLAHYISYAAAVRPARHYVLVLSDHGRGYAPQDDRSETLRPTTRGILYDDGYNGLCLSTLRVRMRVHGAARVTTLMHR